MNSKLLILFLLPLTLFLVSCKTGETDKAASESAQEALEHVTHPAWARNATIYEVNVRQYSQEGTFAAFQEHLPRLKRMGVKILWLMPIHPIGELNRKGTLGSYYSVQNYLEVNPEFGTMDDLKALVNSAHELGMYVIIDWVANHCAWDNPLVTDHLDWFTKDSSGRMMPPVPDWTDVVDFNYDSPQLRDFMIEAMKYWVREADIDGFRCDVAGMVPLDFWQRARRELDEIKDVFMLAEDENPDEHSAFDMTYSWELMHTMNAIYAGDKNCFRLDKYFQEQAKNYQPGDYRMNFITNHDENSWNGTVLERLGEGAKAFAVLAALAPGMPLVYSGQEAGLDRRLEFFERDPIDWRESDWEDFYTKLLTLNLRYPPLWNGEDGGEFTRYPTNHDAKIFAFSLTRGQEQVIVTLNLSSEVLQAEISGMPASGNFRELFNGRSYSAGQLVNPILAAWSYRVYVKD